MIEPMVMINYGKERIAGNIDSALLEDRIICLDEEITSRSAIMVMKQLLYLEGKDKEKDIFLYINSPGGSIIDGMAIFDTMQYIACDVSTLCVGLAASMGAFLLAAGTPGKRFALPNAEILIHQPLGGAAGQATDVLIIAEKLKAVKTKLNTYLSDFTGKSITEIERDTERDNWMTAEEAVKYGIIDEIKTSRK